MYRLGKKNGFGGLSYLPSYSRGPTDRRGPVSAPHPRAAALEQPPRASRTLAPGAPHRDPRSQRCGVGTRPTPGPCKGVEEKG